MADYGKQKSAKPPRNKPTHSEHNAFGGPANPFGPRPDKAALLERMKANARKGRPDDGGEEAGAPDARPEVRPEGAA